MSESRDLCVLLGDALCGVDHDNADVAALDRHLCAQNAVFLDVVVNTALAAESRGIREIKPAVAVLDQCVDRVTRGARDVGHDTALGRGYFIDERGLARVRLADNRDIHRVLAFLLFVGEGQVLIHRVEQIARAVAVYG